MNETAVLVCVTGQRDCDRLIRAGQELAQERGTQLQVLCVQPTSKGADADCEELEYLRQTARSANADMTVYFDDGAPYVAAAFARQIHAVYIVTGMAEVPVNGFVDVLHSLLPKLPIAMVGKDRKVYNICPQGSDCQRRLAHVCS